MIWDSTNKHPITKRRPQTRNLSAVHPLPGSLGARKLIVDRSLEYLDALAGDASASEEVQLDVARGYLRLSDILGRDYERASLGHSAEALKRAEQAVALARAVGRSGAGLEHAATARHCLVCILIQLRGISADQWPDALRRP